MENYYQEQPLRSLASAESMEDALRELFDTAEPLPEDGDLFDVENKLALLNLMRAAPHDERRVYLWIRGYPEGMPSQAVANLAVYYAQSWDATLGIEWTTVGRGTPETAEWVAQIKGVHARPLALTEAGRERP